MKNFSMKLTAVITAMIMLLSLPCLCFAAEEVSGGMPPAGEADTTHFSSHSQKKPHGMPPAGEADTTAQVPDVTAAPSDAPDAPEEDPADIPAAEETGPEAEEETTAAEETSAGETEPETEEQMSLFAAPANDTKSTVKEIVSDGEETKEERPSFSFSSENAPVLVIVAGALLAIILCGIVIISKKKK